GDHGDGGGAAGRPSPGENGGGGGQGAPRRGEISGHEGCLGPGGGPCGGPPRGGGRAGGGGGPGGGAVGGPAQDATSERARETPPSQSTGVPQRAGNTNVTRVVAWMKFTLAASAPGSQVGSCPPTVMVPVTGRVGTSKARPVVGPETVSGWGAT